LLPTVKYVLGACLGWPLLPLLYYQGQQIRAQVPELPEAQDPQGIALGQHNDPFHLITIGESTIAGVGVGTHKEGFTGALASAIAHKTGKSVHWRTWARSGYTVKQVTQRLIPKIDTEQADLLVLGLGGNDAFTLNAPWIWERHVVQLLTTLGKKFPHTPVVFTNMPPIKEFPAFSPLIKFVVGNLVELLGVQLHHTVRGQPQAYYHADIIKLKHWMPKFPGSNVGDFFSDGVHPSKLTYRAWAEDLAQYIFDQEALSEL